MVLSTYLYKESKLFVNFYADVQNKLCCGWLGWCNPINEANHTILWLTVPSIIQLSIHLPSIGNVQNYNSVSLGLRPPDEPHNTAKPVIDYATVSHLHTLSTYFIGSMLTSAWLYSRSVCVCARKRQLQDSALQLQTRSSVCCQQIALTFEVVKSKNRIKLLTSSKVNFAYENY